jgi:hypothetical protein
MDSTGVRDNQDHFLGSPLQYITTYTTSDEEKVSLLGCHIIAWIF